jgi:hypothetical protein
MRRNEGKSQAGKYISHGNLALHVYLLFLPPSVSFLGFLQRECELTIVVFVHAHIHERDVITVSWLSPLLVRVGMDSGLEVRGSLSGVCMAGLSTHLSTLGVRCREGRSNLRELSGFRPPAIRASCIRYCLGVTWSSIASHIFNAHTHTHARSFRRFHTRLTALERNVFRGLRDRDSQGSALPYVPTEDALSLRVCGGG